MADDDSVHDTIRSSTSLIRAPSWSFGIGASDRNITGNRLPPNSYNLRAPYQLEQTQQNRLSSSLIDSSDILRSHSAFVQHENPQFPLTIQIPTVYLTKKRDQDSKKRSSYHVYQIVISTSTGETWSIYRRYSQFYTLHHSLKSKDPVIGKQFRLPPKKGLNSKSSTIVQDRRKRLEDYMILLCLYVEKIPSIFINEFNSQPNHNQHQDQLEQNCHQDNNIDDNVMFTIEDIEEVNSNLNGHDLPNNDGPPINQRSLSVSDSASSQDQNSSSMSMGQSNGSNAVDCCPSNNSGSQNIPTQGTAIDTDPRAHVVSLFLEFISFREKKDEILELTDYSSNDS